MSKLEIEDIKIFLKDVIDATQNDAELKSLLADLAKIASNENTSHKKSRVETEPSVNPISLAASEGLERLVEELEKLDIEQLIAIIKKYGLDKTRNSYRWKSKDKLVLLIKDRIGASSTRGDVFSASNESSHQATASDISNLV